MKKLFLKILFTVILTDMVKANNYDHSFVCRWDNNGKLDNEKEFFELLGDKLIIDGKSYEVLNKIIINNSTISFSTIHTDQFLKKTILKTDDDKKDNVYSSEVKTFYKLSKETGLMVSKQIFKNWKEEETTWIDYYQCEIF